MPWELGLAETQQVLVMNGLRDRIIVQVDGQLKTGRDVVIAALLGAEEFGFATAPLVVSGCIMMRVCHLNTCPVGIATQDPELRKKFTGKPEFVVNFFRFIAEEVREYMAQLGFRTMDEMIGRVDRLELQAGDRPLEGAAASTTRRSCTQPAVAVRRARRARARRRITASTGALDNELIARVRATRSSIGTPVSLDLPIRNVAPHGRHDARLRGHAALRRARACPTTRSGCSFTGSAGQSFGAFVPRGITLTLEGDANDYVGKGLSGGTIVVLSAARRRRSSPRRTSSSATSRCTARPAARPTSAASPASGSPSATAARSRSSKASATTAAST